MSGQAVVARTVAPGTLGTKIRLQTNTFGIGLLAPTTVFIYDVTMAFESKQGKTVLITKKAKEDYMINSRREKAIKAYRHLLTTNAGFFGNAMECWYDGQSILYSKKDFFANSQEVTMMYIVPGAVVADDLDGIDIRFEVRQAVRQSFEVDAMTMASYTANPDLDFNDRSITAFMELALNQYAIMHPEQHKMFPNGKSFICSPEAEGFNPQDVPDVGDGKKLFVGTKKSIRQIEGPQGRDFNNPSIVIDAMKAAFHREMSVLEKAKLMTKESFQQEVNEVAFQRLVSGLKGLGCRTTHNTRSTFDIFDVSRKTAVTYKFECNGVSTSVQQYYQDHGKPLQFPNAPLLLSREHGRISAYPMEFSRVLPNQRVTIPQQSPEQSQLTTRNCAVPPAVRQTLTMKGATSLHLFDKENQYITNAGLKVFNVPMPCDARELPGPTLVFSAHNKVRPTAGKWRAARGYILPTSCDVWAVYRIGARGAEDQNILEQFARMYHTETNKKGMQWNPPADVACLNENELEERLRSAKEANCKFVLMCTPDNVTHVHKRLKLWERDLQMIIQDSKASNVQKVVNDKRVLTLENMINKTNIKCGGLNYSLELLSYGADAVNWLNSDRLVVGIAMAHPPPGVYGDSIPPTTVGYAANFKKNVNEICGDFVYQEGRLVKAQGVMPTILENVIGQYRRCHDNKPPSEIIIYRAGVDEGSFSEILRSEIPHTRMLLAQMGCNAKIVYIVVQKGQALRFYRENINSQAKLTEQNIPPGIVVDSQVCHPGRKEFYLNSHTTLQGSASTPLYSVLVDDLDMSMNELEGLSYALAHSHQIVALTTSLVSPVYIANRYAERGAYLYSEHMARGQVSTQDYLELTNSLSYKDTIFSTRRVNA